MILEFKHNLKKSKPVLQEAKIYKWPYSASDVLRNKLNGGGKCISRKIK